MAGCKRCALKGGGGGGGGKGKGKRREKKRKKEEKMGIKIVFFFFFISPRAGFFICAVVIFQICKKNCI